MALQVNAAGVWSVAKKVNVKISGVWLAAKQLWGYSAGGWRSAWQDSIVYTNTADRVGASIHALMGSPTAVGNYVFINNAVISAGANTFALRTGVFPAGSTLKVINNGYIRGKGGAGGPYNGVGGAGGGALYADMAFTLDNTNGYIFGGGGGGGGAFGYNSTSTYSYAPGGGGAGVTAGAAGTGFGHDTLARQVSIPPSAGTADAGGAGAAIHFDLSGTSYARHYGGAGGGPGIAGVAGTGWDATQTKSSWGLYAGGAAGAAIQLNGLAVSIIAGNNTTQIRGAVA